MEEEKELEEEQKLEEDKRKAKRKMIMGIIFAFIINVGCGLVLHYFFKKDWDILLLTYKYLVPMALIMMGLMWLIDYLRKKGQLPLGNSEREFDAVLCILLFVICPYSVMLLFTLLDTIGIIGFIIIIGIIMALPKVFLTGKF